MSSLRCAACAGVVFVERASGPPCPTCGRFGLIEIAYGYPSEDLWQQVDRGEVVLAGCGITGNDPDWNCSFCHDRHGRSEVNRFEVSLIAEVEGLLTSLSGLPEGLNAVVEARPLFALMNGAVGEVICRGSVEVPTSIEIVGSIECRNRLLSEEGSLPVSFWAVGPSTSVRTAGLGPFWFGRSLVVAAGDEAVSAAVITDLRDAGVDMPAAPFILHGSGPDLCLIEELVREPLPLALDVTDLRGNAARALPNRRSLTIKVETPLGTGVVATIPVRPVDPSDVQCGIGAGHSKGFGDDGPVVTLSAGEVAGVNPEERASLVLDSLPVGWAVTNETRARRIIGTAPGFAMTTMSECDHHGSERASDSCTACGSPVDRSVRLSREELGTRIDRVILAGLESEVSFWRLLNSGQSSARQWLENTRQWWLGRIKAQLESTPPEGSAPTDQAAAPMIQRWDASFGRSTLGIGMFVDRYGLGELDGAPRSEHSGYLSGSRTEVRFADGGYSWEGGYGFGSLSGSWVFGWGALRYLCAINSLVPPSRRLLGEPFLPDQDLVVLVTQEGLAAVSEDEKDIDVFTPIAHRVDESDEAFGHLGDQARAFWERLAEVHRSAGLPLDIRDWRLDAHRFR